MKVSIISIIYQVEPYLRQCLDSIVNQTHKDLEIILVVGIKNDGTDDASLAICNEYAVRDSRIKIQSSLPKGPADARNQGLKMVTGDLLAFVDGDDYIEPDCIEKMVGNMIAHSADIVVCGRFYEYKNATLKDEAKEVRVMNADEALMVTLVPEGFFLHCWDKMYSKRIFRDLYFDTTVRVEDRIVVDKLLGRADVVVYDSTPLYHFRERSESLSKLGGMIKNNIIANEIMQEYLLQAHPATTDYCKRFMLYEYITAMQNILVLDTNKKTSDTWDVSDNKSDLAEYRKKVRMSYAENKNNPQMGRSLKIKALMAIYCPWVLKVFTKVRQKKNMNIYEKFV